MNYGKKLPDNILGTIGRTTLSIVLSFLSDKIFTYCYYYWFRGRSTRHLKSPVMITDKLNWIKLNYHRDWFSTLVDKIEVRYYVESKIGKKYLNDIYLTEDNLTENDYEKLPKQFVIKATHGSGLNMICINKNELSYKSVSKTVNKWLHTKYYKTRREWVYKNVKPRLIVEKYLTDSKGQIPEDYKILCFNGKPEVVQVDFDRFIKHSQGFYDTNWIKLPILYGNLPSKSKILPKPKNFEKMLEIASILSKELPFARIDLYNLDGKIYFGEITLYPAGGSNYFQPIEYEYRYGELLNLDCCK